MPIEFNCPFCGAFIRVPDKAKGGKGKCPKCAQRISVPRKSTLKPPPPAAKEPELAFALPTAPAEPAPSADSDEVVFDEYAAERPSDDILFGTAEEEPPQDGGYQFGSTSASPSEPARRKKKPKTDTAMMAILGVIVVAFMVLAGFILVPILMTDKVVAELTAASGDGFELPPVVIDKSLIAPPPEDLPTVLKKLEQAPATIASASTQISIFANTNGLLISVAPGAQHHFYRVDPSKSEPLKKYLERNQAYLNDRRMREVNPAMVGFVNDYAKALSKKSGAENISAYRDTFAIPSLVKGFGNQLVAHSGRSVYRCIYEDNEGGLYFLLPAGLTEFEIKGREDANGRAVVAVDIKVKVEGKIVPPKMPEVEKPAKPDQKTKPKKGEKSSEADEEEMNGDK